MADDRWRYVDEVLWVRLSARPPAHLTAADQSTDYESKVKNLSLKNDVWIEISHEIDGDECVQFDNGTREKTIPPFRLGRLKSEKTVTEPITRNERRVTVSPSTITTAAQLGYSAEAIDKDGPSVSVDCHTP